MDIQNLAVCATRHMTSQIVVFKTQESKDLTFKKNFNLTKYCQYLWHQFPWSNIRWETLFNVAYILHSNKDIVKNGPQFLGPLVKLRKATLSFVIPVRPYVSLSVHLSVRMEQLGFHWTDFHEIW